MGTYHRKTAAFAIVRDRAASPPLMTQAFLRSWGGPVMVKTVALPWEPVTEKKALYIARGWYNHVPSLDDTGVSTSWGGSAMVGTVPSLGHLSQNEEEFSISRGLVETGPLP